MEWIRTLCKDGGTRSEKVHLIQSPVSNSGQKQMPQEEYQQSMFIMPPLGILLSLQPCGSGTSGPNGISVYKVIT